VPSSLCGVVGLKASLGRIPFRGDGSAFDTVVVVGPITRTVSDNAFLLDVVAGPDPFSLYSLPVSDTDFLSATVEPSVAGARIAYSPDLGDGPIEPAVLHMVAAAAAAFESDLGASVDRVDIDLPDPLDYFVNYWGPQLAYSVVDLKETMGIDPDPLHAEILAHANAMSAPDYARFIIEDRERVHRAFAEIFLEHELLIWPTTPMVAFAHPGPEGGPTEVAGVSVRSPVLQNQRYTEAIAHAGYPAITVPAGWTDEGLPVGLQIAGRHGADADVLRAAAAFETARPWRDRRPAL
jgi:Asp-tRNA(Asn)/Glu-tRNA(Gln) amidotransferase A subunit family amidase